MSDYDYIKSKLAFEYSETFSALAANRELHIKLPAANSVTFFGAWLSADVKVTNAGSGVLTLIESIATAGDGDAIAPVCKSRLDTPPASPVPCFHTPTTPTGGTTIATAAASLSQPGEVCNFILKPATNYLLRLAPTSTPTGVLRFCLKVIPNYDWLYTRKS